MASREKAENWFFFGRVLPERVPVSFELTLGEFTVEKWKLKFVIEQISVQNSQLLCSVVVTDGTVDIDTLRNLVVDKIRLLLDVFGFKRGLRFDLDVISAFSRTSGQYRSFGIGIPKLIERAGADTGRHEIAAEIFHAAFNEMGLEAALADFREAMATATGTGFFCYRAIESMMQTMRASVKDESDAWLKFREALNVDRTAIDYVKDRADDRRHGRIPTISDSERSKIFLLTNDIIERFIQFLLGGKKPLDRQKYVSLMPTEAPAPS